MLDPALDHPAEGLQADVRMRSDAQTLVCRVARGTRVIEKAPGADGAPVAMGQCAANFETVADHGAVCFHAFGCHGVMMRHAGER